MRSYRKSGVLDEIRAAGGEVFAITSEPQSLASEAQEDWEFGFRAVGDPHHEILETCRERGWVTVYANENFRHLRRRSWASHPKGYYQPAVLALGQDDQVLYRWRCIPRRENMSGAGGRPAAAYTWQRIKGQIEAGTDALLDEDPKLAGSQISWPFFLLILLAHGWFLWPRAFPLGRPEDAPSANSGRMMRRVWIFLALWLVAFFVFPAQWVGLAALAWGLAMVPGLVDIYTDFQHEPLEETIG